jgi:hypothetical protein
MVPDAPAVAAAACPALTLPDASNTPPNSQKGENGC